MSKFYKIFSLLMVACFATVGAWAQTPVKTVEDLENGAALRSRSHGCKTSNQEEREEFVNLTHNVN